MLANALHGHLLHCAMATAAAPPAAGKKRSKGKSKNSRQNTNEEADTSNEATDTAAAETPAAWEAIAIGLAALLRGMGSCEALAQLTWTTEGDSVTTLLQRAPTPAATQAVLDIGAAVAGSPASDAAAAWCLEQLGSGAVQSGSIPQLLGMLRCLIAGSYRQAILAAMVGAMGGNRSALTVDAAHSRAAHVALTSADALRCLNIIVTDGQLLEAVSEELPVLAEAAAVTTRAAVQRCCASLEGGGVAEGDHALALEGVVVATRAYVHAMDDQQLRAIAQVVSVRVWVWEGQYCRSCCAT